MAKNIFVSLIYLIGFGCVTRADGQTTKLVVAYASPAATFCPGVIAKREGLFARYGLDVEMVLMQGASLAAQTIRATGALFSCIVILSATQDDASRDAPDAMIAPVVDSNATLHVIANRPGQTAAGSQRSNASLRALAEQSRGEFTVIYAAASYQAALDRLADRLTSEMMIEYLVPVGSKPNDVKVGVRIVGARVRGLGVAPR